MLSLFLHIIIKIKIFFFKSKVDFAGKTENPCCFFKVLWIYQKSRHFWNIGIFFSIIKSVQLFGILHLNWFIKASSVVSPLEEHSLTNFSKNIFVVAIFSVLAIIVSKINSLTPAEINDYPNYVYVYIHQFVYPNLIGFLTSGIYYLNNPTLKETLINAIKFSLKL